MRNSNCAVILRSVPSPPLSLLLLTEEDSVEERGESEKLPPRTE